MAFLFKIFLWGFGLWLLAALALYMGQRKLMFHPDTQRILPQHVGLQGRVEEVVLHNQQGHKLYSWYGKAKGEKPTLLFFHGNGGNVASREEKMRRFMERGYGVFMVGYPGYGGSDGTPSEAAFVKTAPIAYDTLRKQVPSPDHIIIYGESIGSSVAVQLAAKVKARALVLEAPMVSVLAIAQSRYPYVPAKYFLRDPFLSVDYIDQVHMPLFVVHGDQDGIIPIKSGRALFASANEPKQFQTISGGHHNDLYDFPIADLVAKFLEAR